MVTSTQMQRMGQDPFFAKRQYADHYNSLFHPTLVFCQLDSRFTETLKNLVPDEGVQINFM